MREVAMSDERLARIESIAKANEYLATRVIDGKVYGLVRFIYTLGLVVDVNEYGYARRYCYENYGDAVADFASWDGVGHPHGDWIKCKGRDGEFPNPKREEDSHA